MTFSKQKIRGTALLGIIGLAILAFLVKTQASWWNPIDMLIYKIEFKPAPWLATLVTLFAKTATIGPILLVASLVSVFIWRKGFQLLALWNISNILMVSFFGYVLKHVIERSRPALDQIVEKTSYSFPSGHSLLSMALCVSTILSLAIVCDSKMVKRIGRGLMIYAILMGCSRIFLRVHYPSDVLAGFLLSLGAINLSYLIFYKWLHRNEVEEKQDAQGTPARRSRSGMTMAKKLIIAALACALVGVCGATAYAVNFYFNAQKTVAGMYKPLERKELPNTGADSDKKENKPTNILLLGIANNEERQTDFRANTIMLVTINNDKEKTTITSIPRDSLVEIVGEDNLYDKINHAHSFGGIQMMVNTVEKFLDVSIDHYFSLNMDGLADFVEALGGINVNNAFEFDAEGIHYPEGEQHLNGWETLQYARMRMEDPLGDYGRQKRQREVTIKLVEKLTSINSIFKSQELLDVIGDNGQTDMSLNQMIALAKNYQPALKEIDTYQVQGEDFTGDGYTGEYGISYQIIPDEEHEAVKAMIQEQLASDE